MFIQRFFYPVNQQDFKRNLPEKYSGRISVFCILFPTKEVHQKDVLQVLGSGSLTLVKEEEKDVAAQKINKYTNFVIPQILLLIKKLSFCFSIMSVCLCVCE